MTVSGGFLRTSYYESRLYIVHRACTIYRNENGRASQGTEYRLSQSKTKDAMKMLIYERVSRYDHNIGTKLYLDSMLYSLYRDSSEVPPLKVVRRSARDSAATVVRTSASHRAMGHL